MKDRTEANPESDPLLAVRKQWAQTSELIKRVALEDEGVRVVLSSFANAPVENGLAGELVSAVSSVNARVMALVRRNENLQKALDGTLPVDFKSTLNRERICFSRDVKLISLAAELVTHPPVIDGSDEEHVLPSGIRLFLAPAYSKEGVDLLNPDRWKNRKQRKDRVYTIEVGSKSYILKEKKTARHRDTFSGGHEEPLDAAQEFAVARDFCEHGQFRHEDVFLEWERPIGYVVFPDGFQFTVFETNEAIASSKGIFDTTFSGLTQHILEHPDQFKEEYEEIATLAEDPANYDPRAMRYKHPKSRQFLDFLKQTFIRGSKKLRYEEYAVVKAQCMYATAYALYFNTIRALGYYNRDRKFSLPDCAFFVRDNPKVELCATGFDFEYFLHNGKTMNRDLSNLSHQVENGVLAAFTEEDRVFSETPPVQLRGMNVFQAVAYLALLKKQCQNHSK